MRRAGIALLEGPPGRLCLPWLSLSGALLPQRQGWGPLQSRDCLLPYSYQDHTILKQELFHQESDSRNPPVVDERECVKKEGAWSGTGGGNGVQRGRRKCRRQTSALQGTKTPRSSLGQPTMHVTLQEDLKVMATCHK